EKITGQPDLLDLGILERYWHQWPLLRFFELLGALQSDLKMAEVLPFPVKASYLQGAVEAGHGATYVDNFLVDDTQTVDTKLALSSRLGPDLAPVPLVKTLLASSELSEGSLLRSDLNLWVSRL